MADTNDIIRLAVWYGLPAASQALNVMYFRILDAVDNSIVLEDLEAYVLGVWGSNWAAFGASTASIIAIDADIVDFEGHVLENIGSETMSIPGTVVTDPTSAGDAAYFKADTASPKTRGSKYVPGIAEDNVDAGLLDATILGELVIMLADYVVGFLGESSIAAYQAGVPSRTLLAWKPFTGSGTFTDVIAYQRRRKLGVGS